MREMEEKAIRDILTDENIEKIERTNGISLSFVLHLYHETGRNPKKLNEAIESFFEGDAELLDTLQKNIDLLKKEIQTTRDLRKGLLRDKVVDKNP